MEIRPRATLPTVPDYVGFVRQFFNMILSVLAIRRLERQSRLKSDIEQFMKVLEKMFTLCFWGH